MRKKPKVVACIPAYNEEETITKVVVQTMKYVDKVVVCDDGSTGMAADYERKAFLLSHAERLDIPIDYSRGGR